MKAALRTVLPLVLLASFLQGSHLVAQLYPSLHSYESCTFSDGLAVVELAPLSPGVSSRSVQTRLGTRSLQMVAGRRVMFAYPETDFYANVKVEVLPASSYPTEKQLVLDGFDYSLGGSPDFARNYDLKAHLNGFEIQGMDRNKLEGGTLGLYLLFDDAEHIATTIYLLNQHPEQRKFQSLQDYVTLRDRFLQTYTACVRNNAATLRNGDRANLSPGIGSCCSFFHRGFLTRAGTADRRHGSHAPRSGHSFQHVEPDRPGRREQASDRG